MEGKKGFEHKCFWDFKQKQYHHPELPTLKQLNMTALVKEGSPGQEEEYIIRVVILQCCDASPSQQ